MRTRHDSSCFLRALGRFSRFPGYSRCSCWSCRPCGEISRTRRSADGQRLVQVVHTRLHVRALRRLRRGILCAGFDRVPDRIAPCPARGALTIEEGHKLRLALRLAGVTQARAAKVLDARQTQLSAWMALGKGPDDVVQRLEAAFGFRTDALVDACPRRAGNVLCHGYKARGSSCCAACAVGVPVKEYRLPSIGDPNVVTSGGQGSAAQSEPTCVSCGRSEADQVRLRPARMLSGGVRRPLSSAAAGAVFICTQCRNAHRHQLHRCPDCDGWMRAGRDRCHRCALRAGGSDVGAS